VGFGYDVDVVVYVYVVCCEFFGDGVDFGVELCGGYVDLFVGFLLFE